MTSRMKCWDLVRGPYCQESFVISVNQLFRRVQLEGWILCSFYWEWESTPGKWNCWGLTFSVGGVLSAWQGQVMCWGMPFDWEHLLLKLWLSSAVLGAEEGDISLNTVLPLCAWEGSVDLVGDWLEKVEERWSDGFQVYKIRLKKSSQHKIIWEFGSVIE